LPRRETCRARTRLADPSRLLSRGHICEGKAHRVKKRLPMFALLAALVVGGSLPPLRLAADAVLLIPSVMGANIRPLEWFTGTPRHDVVAYMGEDAAQRAEVWTPARADGAHRVGAVLLVFGVNQKGRAHPQVQRVAAAIARTGVAVMVPDSALLRTGRLDPREVDGVVQAFQSLSRRMEVDPDKVGMFGFSAGGSLALLAASDGRIASQVRYVNTFGAFADTRSYLASLAAHAYEVDGHVVDWKPAELAIEGYPQLVLQEVPNRTDRNLLASAYGQVMLSGSRPVSDAGLASQLGYQATCIYRLMIAKNLQGAREAIDNLAPETQQVLHDLSPLEHLDGLRAPVFVMHGLDDDLVPYVESRRLADALRARGHLARFSEFTIFKHVQAADLDPVAAAPQLWNLVWYLQAVLAETA
jgi:acetyl esterase/lipase